MCVDVQQLFATDTLFGKTSHRLGCRCVVCRFNSKLGRLAQQKRIDIDRITDLGTRIDELTRELAKVNALEDASAGAAAAAGGGGGAALLPYWSPLEDLEEVLFSFKDGDIKVGAVLLYWGEL